MNSRMRKYYPPIPKHILQERSRINHSIVSTVEKLYELDGLNFENCLQRELMEYCARLKDLRAEYEAMAVEVKDD